MNIPREYRIAGIVANHAMILRCDANPKPDGVPEAGRHIDRGAIGQRDHRADTGDRHQAPAHIIIPDDGQHAAMQDGELLANDPQDQRDFMATRLSFLALTFGTVALSAVAYAQSTSTGVLKLPQDIEFKGPLTGPPQTVVLYGDPTKAGVFVSRVKFSAGWKDPPHWHPDEVRTVVVLSGTLYFGSGDKWDESKFRAYPAGTFYSEPPRAPHLAGRRTVR